MNAAMSGGPPSDTTGGWTGGAPGVSVVLIAAVGADMSIGASGRLPWRLPGDLERFKRLTLGHPVVMGRRTFESIGRPLPGRANVVVTRRQTTAPYSGGDGTSLHVVGSVTDALLLGSELARAAREADPPPGGGPPQPTVFVAGGGEIYAAAMFAADRLEITHVDLTVPEADTWFPAIDEETWALVAMTPSEPRGDEPSHRFATYRRRD